MPKDLPPWSTVYRWFAAWRDAYLFEKINHALVITDRERVGREASPSAAIIDSRSIKTTEAGGPRGYDAGKKINGRKRHALVDTDGRGLLIEPHPASIQDRDGGGPLLQASRRLFPFIERVFADGGYAGERVATATRIIVEIVAKSPDQIGFAVLPRRWVVERFFAGSAATEGLPKISRPASTPPGPSFTPLPSCCSHAASQGTHEFRNRLYVRLGLHSVPHVARMEKVEWLVVDVPQLLRATLLFIIDDDFPNEREEISKKSRQILSAADMQALSNEIPCREPTVLNAPLH